MRRGWLIAAALVGSSLLTLAATRAPSSQPNPTTAGSEACQDCHEDYYKSWQSSEHGRAVAGTTPTGAGPACETCHGPGSLHVAAAGDTKDPGFATMRVLKKMPADEADAVCLQCHNSGEQFYWAHSKHAEKNVACIQCHTVHHGAGEKAATTRAPERPSQMCLKCHNSKRMSASRSSHMPLGEGGMECTSCHNPHGASGEKAVRFASNNELCESCHADKRGPMLWEHAPVREDCVTCHEPHGANNDKLLSGKRPFLCQRCHVATRHPSSVYDYPDLASNRLATRSCTNCHSQVHGSNHPSGKFFLR